MYIDKKSPIPVYFQLKNIVLDKIKNGEYQEGSLIPSERDLGENLGISRMTVRQALNQLVSEGVLYREKGKGTFVSKSKIVQRNIMSFSETVRKKGLVPSTNVLDFAKVTNRPDIMEILELNGNEGLYCVKRLRLANDQPIAIEEVFIPERYCPHLDKHDLKMSLYTLLKEEYSLSVNYMDSSVEAAKASKEERKLLGLADNTPVLRISSISYNEAGVKLLHQKDVYRSDEYNYNVRIFVNREA
ncbi:MAG TPA: GntR family transcriptional regulator [Clostridia bacterium]|nr:GntR family transcriptional regulator [Clostridia bacterium]